MLVSDDILSVPFGMECIFCSLVYSQWKASYLSIDAEKYLLNSW